MPGITPKNEYLEGLWDGKEEYCLKYEKEQIKSLKQVRGLFYEREQNLDNNM